ncbi:MAG TPA: hypothetical protein VK447_06010 [Myxococcaceae bacterium]|nr:hypothetical protein [Myxococcaceae bacterium]
MLLSDAQALLDRCFAGVAQGATRLYEPEDPRFLFRPSAVWLEYRWYIHERTVAEVFLKWKRVPVEACSGTKLSVMRIHVLGASAELSRRAHGALEGGTPSPERILGVFGDDGIRRECVSFGGTSVTVEQWESGPRELLGEEELQRLSGALAEPPTVTPEERHEAIQRLSAERSERVAQLLVQHVEARPSMMAFRVLSEWGVLGAREPLRRAIASVAPDNAADLWALVALERRLDAWAALAERG